jgi:hypothetical protein
MNILKIVLCLLALGFASSSSIAYAENNAEVKAALDQTVAKLEQAVAAFDKGEDTKAVVDMILEAKQLQKPIATSDGKVSVIKSKANNNLGKARTSFNDGDTKGGGELLKEALAGYKEVKEKYNATH